jgi:DNA-binding transcriptional regulator YiaG
VIAMAEGRDPFDIVPDDFTDAWDASSIPDALERAERGKSTTPASDQPRCPVCKSIRIKTKTATVKQSNQIDTPYRCINSHHFRTPLEPASQDDVVSDIDLSVRQLRVTRKKLDLSFEDAAVAVGVTTGTIRSWEMNDHIWSSQTRDLIEFYRIIAATKIADSLDDAIGKQASDRRAGADRQSVAEAVADSKQATLFETTADVDDDDDRIVVSSASWVSDDGDAAASLPPTATDGGDRDD